MKKTVFMSTIIIYILNITINIYASSFKYSVTTETTELRPGDTVMIEMRVSDIQTGNLGINTVEGYLEYDEKVFEKVTQENLTGENDWKITYNGGEGERKGKYLVSLLKPGEVKDTTIASVKMKVKNYIDDKETVIKFTKIATNNGEEIVEETDKEIRLKIKNDNSNDNDGDTGDSSGNENGNSDNKEDGSSNPNNGNSDGDANGNENGDTDNSSGNNNGNSNNKEDGTSNGSNNGNDSSNNGNNGNKHNYNVIDNFAEGKIPKTGKIPSILIILLLVLLVARAILAIRNFKLYKNIDKL